MGSPMQSPNCKGSKPKHRLPLTTVSSSTALERTETCFKVDLSGHMVPQFASVVSFFFVSREGGDTTSSGCGCPWVHCAERHDQSLADTFFDTVTPFQIMQYLISFRDLP